MRISDKPTDYLLIKICLDKRLLNCNYAIAKVPDEWKEIQQERLSFIRLMQNVPELTSITFDDESAKFYINPKLNLSDTFESMLQNGYYAFINVDEKYLQGLGFLHEFALASYALDITSDGSAKFLAYYGDGIHIHTEEFSLNDILQ